MGEMDNTLFLYVVGDNGASAEGGPEGTYNEMMALSGIIGNASQMMNHIDDWGSANTFPHYAIGWAGPAMLLSNGPSRSPHILVAPVMVWSFIGLMG
jgi:hypothetical protein